ncbi:hypothetical protein SAMN02746066_02526 [Anaerosporobacter mobilis DSM 15930]|uniref:Uncharacterized protein n=1 Tax=Anaerosporobacter mobilis DSM 15930 TaxID=1120996 RepID=A0A1M7K0J6_9FIRM|nr:hypothetical protein SAMN02746066_02526 [Anaerosporobacter mobilis DSM 15930]
MKSVLAKILFGIGTILLICFFGGLVYLYYDYYKLSPYASTPLYVYNVIHGLIFLPPSILCYIIALILRSKIKTK